MTTDIGKVSDNGEFALVNLTGELVLLREYNDKTYDLEAVSAGPLPGYAYVAVEDPPQIIEVSSASGLMLRAWNIEMPTSDGAGIEALTYVPVTAESGYFYVGNQSNGLIYIVPFHFNVLNLPGFNGTSLAPARAISLVEGKTDLSGLNWDQYQKQLWLLYDDGADAYTFYNTTPITMQVGSNVYNWVLDKHYDVPGKHQEGISIAGHSGEYLVLGEDRDSQDDRLVRYDYSP
mmetsp:Transcript_19258/g.27095  ORF Transcript_19258/g.27095 Transcript_19258/m.27095 type:complete len:233 (-) Transcript_19258:1364-2062(-)